MSEHNHFSETPEERFVTQMLGPHTAIFDLHNKQLIVAEIVSLNIEECYALLDLLNNILPPRQFEENS